MSKWPSWSSRRGALAVEGTVISTMLAYERAKAAFLDWPSDETENRLREAATELLGSETQSLRTVMEWAAWHKAAAPIDTRRPHGVN